MFTIHDIDNDEYSKVEEPDPSVSYTYADYLQWKFEERVELFKGRILRLSAPNRKHQEISRDILLSMGSFLKEKRCQLFSAPFDVRLPVKNKKKDTEITTVVQPDICVVCDESILDARGCCGAPDLIIEILSPGNSRKEIKLKFELYEEAGVKEYWVVYPGEESVAVFAINKNGKYDGAKLYAGGDIINSSAVPGLAITLTDIFTN
jgi:Uma2 family endonuclease